MGQVILAGSTKTTSLVPCLLSYVIATHVKVLNRFHLKVPNLQMSCKDLIARQATKTQMARFMGPTWGPSGSCWPQMGLMLASWTLLSGNGSPINSWEMTCPILMKMQTMSCMIKDRRDCMNISVSQPGPQWFTNDEYAIGILGKFNWQFMH